MDSLINMRIFRGFFSLCPRAICVNCIPQKPYVLLFANNTNKLIGSQKAIGSYHSRIIPQV